LLVAKLVDLLKEAKARTVALDLLLDRLTGDADQDLKRAIENHGKVVVAEHLLDPDGTPFVRRSHPTFGEKYVPGFANVYELEALLFSDKLRVAGVWLWALAIRPRTALSIPDAIDIKRQLKLSNKEWHPQLGEVDEKTYDAHINKTTFLVPSLALAAAWLHRSGATPSDWKEVFNGLGDISLADLGLNQERSWDNSEDPYLQIYWRGGASSRHIDTVSAAELLGSLKEFGLPGAATDGTESAVNKRLKGKLVVVGRSDRAAQDHHITPHDFPLYKRADFPGMRIHAEAMDNLLRGTRVRRIPGWLTVILAILLVGGIIRTSHRLRPGVHILVSAGALAALVGLGMLLYRGGEGLIFDAQLPLLAGIGTLIVLHWRNWMQLKSPRPRWRQRG